MNIQNSDKYTALILAAGKGHIEVVHALLKSKTIQLEIKNKFGKNALILACEMGYLPIVKVLLKEKVDINAVSNRG